VTLHQLTDFNRSALEKLLNSARRDGLLRRELENTEERRVGVGGDVVAVEVVDPDLLVAVEPGGAGCEASLVTSVVCQRRVGVGADGIDARPALKEHLVVDHHRETAACRRVVIQNLTRRHKMSYTHRGVSFAFFTVFERNWGGSALFLLFSIFHSVLRSGYVSFTVGINNPRTRDRGGRQ